MDGIETKPWYTSKTILAGILVVSQGTLVLIDTTFGTNISLDPTVVAVLTFVGGMIAIYGRVTAVTTIEK